MGVAATSTRCSLWRTEAHSQEYSAAKFAVKDFTEALIEDLRTNAPQVRVAE
jgi:short-subunit dehydrogenase